MIDSQRTSKVLTIPNVLTMMRLVVIPFFVLASLESYFTVAFVLFVSAGISDGIDGYIARRLNQRSKLGALLDPAADKTMMISAYLVYTLHRSLDQPLPVWLTFTVFARDFLIVCFAYLLYTRVQVKRFPPSMAGKTSTVFQIVTLSVTIAANTFLRPVAQPLLTLLFPATLLMTLYSGFDYLRRAQAMLEPAESA